MSENTPKSVQELKNQGQAVFAYTTGDQVTFYFRKPSKQDVIYFQSDIESDTGSSVSKVEKFIRKLFCGDNTQEFAEYLETKPLAISEIAKYALKDLTDSNFSICDL